MRSPFGVAAFDLPGAVQFSRFLDSRRRLE